MGLEQVNFNVGVNVTRNVRGSRASAEEVENAALSPFKEMSQMRTVRPSVNKKLSVNEHISS